MNRYLFVVMIFALMLSGCKVNHLMIDGPNQSQVSRIQYKGYSVWCDTKYTEHEKENVVVIIKVFLDSSHNSSVTLEKIAFFNENTQNDVSFIGIKYYDEKLEHFVTVSKLPVTIAVKDCKNTYDCVIVRYEIIFDITNKENINAVVSYNLTVNGENVNEKHRLVTKKHNRISFRNPTDILLFPFYILLYPLIML